jgi:hypothetical protein
MPLIDRLYEWFAQGPSPDCDYIFAAALPYAEPLWADRMIRVLLRRGHDASWAALVGQYDRLTPEIRALLHQQGERMPAGIALALKSPLAETRANALRALEQHPLVGMAYLLPNAIRDSSRAVRELAARSLHKMADSFLGQPAPPAEAGGDLLQVHEDQRQQLTLALDEALQAFDLHSRIEVLEACLWFSRDLGESLWSKLTPHRSHAATLVAQQVPEWNDARLAHFLLSGLKHSTWRQTAVRLLQGWKTVAEVTALLRQDDLLRDPTIRQYLRSIHSPRWFTEIDDDLAQLEPALRPLAPRWVSRAGYTDSEKLKLLSCWLQTSDPDLHSAAVHAVTQIDSPDARRLLKQVANGGSSLAPFAGWCADAFDTDAVTAALDREVAAGTRSDASSEGEPARSEEIDADCAMLWQACRRTPPQARGELIATLRENAWVWQAHLRSYLQSAEPRDRVLALQVISTPQLAQRFRDELEPLLDDPVEGIRQLARRLAQALPEESPPPGDWPLETAPRSAPSDPQTLDQARSELSAKLEQLSSGAADPTDTELIGRVRDLLREVYAERSEPELAAATGEEG